MLNFHEPHRGPLLVGSLPAFLKCNVKYLLRLHQGWELWTCSGKCTGPGKQEPGCSSGSGSLFQLSSLFIPEQEGTGLGIVDSSPKLPHSFYIPLSIMEASLISLQNCTHSFLQLRSTPLCGYILMPQLTCAWTFMYFPMVVDVSSKLISGNTELLAQIYKSTFNFLTLPNCIYAPITFFDMQFSKNEISIFSNTIYKSKWKMD